MSESRLRGTIQTEDGQSGCGRRRFKKKWVSYEISFSVQYSFVFIANTAPEIMSSPSNWFNVTYRTFWSKWNHISLSMNNFVNSSRCSSMQTQSKYRHCRRHTFLSRWMVPSRTCNIQNVEKKISPLLWALICCKFGLSPLLSDGCGGWQIGVEWVQARGNLCA